MHTVLLLMASKIDKKLALIAANEHNRSAATAPPNLLTLKRKFVRLLSDWKKHTVTRQM